MTHQNIRDLKKVMAWWSKDINLFVFVWHVSACISCGTYALGLFGFFDPRTAAKLICWLVGWLVGKVIGSRVGWLDGPIA